MGVGSHENAHIAGLWESNFLRGYSLSYIVPQPMNLLHFEALESVKQINSCFPVEFLTRIHFGWDINESPIRTSLIL